MKAIYVNSDGIDYAAAIVGGYKKIETRTKNMLGLLDGERVAVVRTRKGKQSEVVGYVNIVGKQYVKKPLFDKMFAHHLVPTGSKYDCKPNGGKWCYYLARSEKCDPYPLPANAVRHGRSWCEF